MAPVRISLGPEPIMTLDLNSSSLVPHHMMFGHNSSSLGLQCQKTFKQIGSSLAPFLKDKKGVCFSALYLQQKRNLLVLDHSHLQRSLLHDNIVPKPDLALELGKSISLTEVEEEAIAREVHATHARIVSESELEPTQTRQSGIAFRDSFIVSKKRSSDSSKKFKGIQTLTPAKQEAADIMKALKESKKMSKRQAGTGGSNEGTGNILGVPDESTVVSKASSEGTGSKPG
ncbi:hypothetical protein Tco_0085060 [Tanacetum coccineum]